MGLFIQLQQYSFIFINTQLLIKSKVQVTFLIIEQQTKNCLTQQFHKTSVDWRDCLTNFLIKVLAEFNKN